MRRSSKAITPRRLSKGHGFNRAAMSSEATKNKFAEYQAKRKKDSVLSTINPMESK